MPEEAPQRRFLIATGVTVDLPKTADRLRASVGQMTEIFQRTFGYERVPPLDLNPTTEDMRHELRQFAPKCTPTDVVALYHTGHADLVAGKYRLWMGNTGDPLVDTLTAEEIAQALLYQTPVSNLLIILDTCHAGQGGTEALQAGLNAMDGYAGKTLLTITAAYPKEVVRAGDFAHLFSRSVNHFATGGYQPLYLAPDAVVGHINDDDDREEWHTVSYSTIFLTGEPRFLPNPRHNAAFAGLDVASQLQIEEEEDERRQEDLEKFFSPRARGVDIPQEVGWFFEGRHAALRDLTRWLANQKDLRTIVVTGGPGSGKSAVIGRLYLLSDPDRRWSVPHQGLPEDTIPPEDSIDVAIHARNRTSDEVLRGLCHAANIEAATPAEFLRRLAGKPMVAAIDAIDEAVDPHRLVSAILNPLIDAGPQAGFRMLLGTRSHLLSPRQPGQRRPGRRWLSEAAHRIDLDDAGYADPQSLRVYAEKRLRAVPGSPYADDADPARIRAVAGAVAQAAGRSFLVALITSRTLAAQADIADPDDPAWLDGLPGTAAEAMQQDLESRLGDDAVRACDLLRPLAYAGGSGLPWEGIWPRLAERLAGRRYGDDDMEWLRRNAGSYVVESAEWGRSVYRLYHAALSEYLRHGQDEKRVHGEFVEFLLGHVPRAGGVRDWPEAHPYILAHLATHAAAAGKLGELVTDPGYLAYAAPLALLAGFAAERDPGTRLTGVAYRRAMHQLRGNDLADRLSYLELAAQRARAEALVERIAACPVQRRWSVRWNQWPPDHPHRVLAGHHGPVREVTGLAASDQTARAASVGDDGTLRLWDVESAEQLGVHEVGDEALAAIDVVELPGPKQVAVVLSAAGFLTAHELPSMSRELNIPVRSGFRGWLNSMQLAAPEMRCVRLPDGRWAAVTGGPGMVTTIWDIRMGTPIVRLQTGLRPARLEFRKLASGVPVVVSIDPRVGAEHIFDLATGQHLPTGQSLLIAAEFTYYCRPDGTPVIGLRDANGLFSRDTSTLFDLTGPEGDPVRAVKLGGHSNVRLMDGSILEADYSSLARYWRIESVPGQEPVVPLKSTASGPGTSMPTGVVYAKHARPSDRFPFVVTLDGRVIRLAPAPAAAGSREEVVLTGHGDNVTDADAVRLPGAAAGLVSSSIDGTVRVWDIAADVRAAQIPATSDPSAAVLSTMIHEERVLGLTVTAEPSGTAALLDLGTGEQVIRLNGTASGMVVAATCGWVPGIGNAAVIFASGVAFLWRLSDGEYAGRFRTYAYDPVTSQVPLEARYLPVPGRSLVLTCGHDNKAVVWDLAARTIHAVLGRHSGLTSALGVTARGARIAATGGHDNTVNIWDPVRGRHIGHLRIAEPTTYLRNRDSGRSAAVGLALAGPQIVVLVLCEDGKLRIFQKRRRRPGYRRVCLAADGASSLVVMELTDGRTIAVTGGRDGRLRAWDLRAVLGAAGPGGSGIPPLIDIETEVAITNLCAGSADTVVLSALNGLAAVKFHALPLQHEL
jgi:WD40 repeat protein